MHPRITEARVLSAYILELSFTDGSRGTVDLAQWIGPSRGVFAALQDPAFLPSFRWTVTPGPSCGPTAPIWTLTCFTKHLM